LCTELRVTFIICLFFEPTVMNYEDSDVRHWRFIYESVQDLQDKLNPTNSKLYFHSEVQPVFAELLKHYNINTVFSHQEIGNKCTYRDLTMKVFFKITKSTGKSRKCMV
jgi:deoxyribodipyrimidine photo-lyase